MILVTGATGANGTELLKALSAQAAPVRAMVRSLDTATAIAALPGVELVTANFDNPASLDGALQGIDRAFLLTPSSERAEAQQLGFVEAAGRTRVRHIVKLSQFAAAEDSPVRFLRYHAAVERAIRKSGIAWTFLRPNLYMQGLLGFRETILAKGQFFAAIGDARVSAVDVRDIAAVAAAALTEPGHESRIYDLTGPEALTHAEMAEQLGHAIGRDIRFVDVPPQAMLGALLDIGVPRWQAEGLIEDYAHYSRGEASTIATGVKDATGQKPRPFAAFARDYAPAFAP